MELNNLLVSSKTMTIHSIMCCDAKWIVRICSVWELYSRAPGGPGPGTLCRISKHRTTSSPGSSSETLRGVWIWLFNTSKERYWKRLCCHIFDIYVLRTQLILVPQKYWDHFRDCLHSKMILKFSVCSSLLNENNQWSRPQRYIFSIEAFIHFYFSPEKEMALLENFLFLSTFI